MATITFDQVGLTPPGIIDRSRSDGLVDGSKVTITLDQTGTVTFVDVPEGDVNSVASLAEESPLVWSFTPTAGIYGSWLVEFQPLEGASARRVFAVRTPERGLRIPAFNERASSSATLANGASFIDESDDNEGGSYRGWAKSLTELYQAASDAGDVAGPASATSNLVATFDGTTGKLLKSTSTPALGTPASATLTNATGLPISTGVSGLGTGVATFLATPSSANLAAAVTGETGTGALVFATSPALVTPALGTPASGTLTSCTGLPISTGVAGLGTGVATFLTTPTSANLAAAVTDESGTGALLFATSPAITTHASRHQDGGADEISVAGLSGTLADPQTAGGIKTATTTVSVSAAAAPTTGQMLTASSSTAAAWATPPLATTSVDGYMPATAVTKLATIATNADVTLTALSTAASDIAVNSKKITGLANPTQAQDAATKGYADAVTQGLDVKQSCRVIATTNITLSGTQTIDGVAVQVGDRVLCAGQTTGSTNGIYVVAASAWTRAADADISAEVTSGMFAFVVEGTGNADSGWVLTTLDPIVLGTTALVFAQFSGAGQIQAGTGLTKNGNTLNVVANADASIVVAADDVRVGVLATDVQHGTRGGGTQHAAVTTGANGFMLAADKVKLDGVAAGAAALSDTAPTQIYAGTVGSPGVVAEAARRDHFHQVSTAAPVALVVGGPNVVGGNFELAKAAHVHALPAFGTTAGTFCEGNDARLITPAAHAARHQDGGGDEISVTGLSGTLADPQTAGGLKTTTTVVAIAASAAPSAGQTLIASSTTAAAWSTPVQLTNTEPPALFAGGISKVGNATEAARRDHSHGLSADWDPTVLVVGGGGVIGNSDHVARGDHRHGLPPFGTGGGQFCEGNDGRFPAIDPSHRGYFRSTLPADYNNPFTCVKDTIYWIYLGRVNRDITTAQAEGWQITPGTGSVNVLMCVGTTPNAPGWFQGRTITTRSVVTCNVPGGAGGLWSEPIATIGAGQYLWVGIKCSYSGSQPKFPNLFSGSVGGIILSTPGITGNINNNTNYNANAGGGAQFQAPDICLGIQ